MIYLKCASILLLLLVFAQTLNPTSNCPQLCASNCTSGGSCSSCYENFASTALTNSTCSCPVSMYKGSDYYCKPCPIQCLTCTNYSKCTTCIPGYMLQNNYACIPSTTNDRGWVGMNMSQPIAGSSNLLDFGVEDLVMIANGQAINITKDNKAQYQSMCTVNSPTISWFGGYLKFGYSTKLIKTLYSLPPHQWINVMFEAILIDRWQDNTLLLEMDQVQNYDPNMLSNPKIVWSGKYNSAIRNYDFCGSSSYGDNLAVINVWTAHSGSSVKLQIRLNESDLTVTNTSNLQQLYFGIRELFIRVGTCGRNCQYCSSPVMCTQCYPPYSAVNGSCVCSTSLGVGFSTETGCSLPCVNGEYYNATAKACLNCIDSYQNCQSCNSTNCLICSLGFFYLPTVDGKGQCLKYCPSNWTQARGISFVLGNQNFTRDECVSCPQNCMTCNLNICIFCSPGYQYFEGICVTTCPIAFFAYMGTCLPCSRYGNCLNCTSAGCVACDEGLTIINKICLPACFNGSTSLANSSFCNTFHCTSPCSTCYGNSSTQCLSCVSGYVFQGECLSSCSNGLYSTGSRCEKCTYGCATCTNSTYCLSCIVGFFMSSNLCVRLCPAGKYPVISNYTNTYNITTVSSTCEQCEQGCTRCLDSATCFQCKDQYYLFNFSCTEDKHDDYQWENGRFRKCSANCLKCKHKICQRCVSGWYLNQGECVSECPVKKYKRSAMKYDHRRKEMYVENVCAWRSPLCQDYATPYSDGSCLKCSFTYPASVLVLNLFNSTQCLFSCPIFFTKTQNLTCIPCPNNCIRCTPNMTCLKCLDTHVANNPNLITSANVMNETCLLYVCGQGLFSDSYQCQSCSVGCKVCLLDGTCYQCKTGFSLDPSSKLCIQSGCKLGQYFNYLNTSASGNQCFVCSSTCRSCYTTASNCTSCPKNPTNQTYLSGNTCVVSCPVGYFAHYESRTCRKCDPRCSSCSDIRNCTSCSHDFYLLTFYDSRHTPCVAECPVGFWVNQTQCTRCYQDCKSCYGPSQYQCLQCYPNFFLDEGKCVYKCGAMKYRDRRTDHCQWCHPSCQQCWGPTKYGCISCQTGKYYYDHQCWANSCPASTYLSIPELRLCEPCQFGCIYCSSSQFCHFCTSGLYFYKGWCYDKCPGNLKAQLLRYYMQLPGYVCQPCESQYTSRCLRCDTYSCTKCKEGYYLYRGENTNQYDSNTAQNGIQQCHRSCPSGTYLRQDGSNECIQCAANCKYCASFSQCTQCNSAYTLINGYCSQYCPASTYQTSSGCHNCQSPCLSCTSSTACTSCLSGYWLYYSSTYSTVTCTVTCPSTYYADPSGWCLRCPSTCVTCSNATTCTSCISGYSIVNGMCQSSSVTTCTEKCEQCSGGVCVKCNSPYALYTNPNTGQTTCVSSCPTGFYLNIFKCEKCNSTCTTCSNTANNCTSCATGLYQYGQSCVAACKIGFYADPASKSCIACNSNCLNCFNSNCTLCAAGYYLYNGICYAQCPVNTFASSWAQMCYPCPSSCSSCSDFENCTSCLTGTYLYNSTCLTQCPSGSYLLETAATMICMPCTAPCYTCSDSSTCLTCIGGYILNGTICQHECSQGYYMQTYQVEYLNEVEDEDFSIYSQCQPCNVQCLTCSNSSSNCLICSGGYLMASGSCVQICPPATVNISNICMNCPNLCLQCSNANQCQVCASAAVLFEDRCQTACPQGYYASLVTNTTLNSATYNCSACSQNCKTCNGGSQYNCLSCKQNYYLSEGMCLFACPAGTFASNATQSCVPCPASCLLCTSMSNCQACAANYILSSTNQCYQNSTIICTAIYCASCQIGSSSACQQCIAGFFLMNGSYCVVSCHPGTYAVNQICVACQQNCATCTATGCLTCSNTTYLYQGECLSTCPAGTHPNQGICSFNPCLYYNTSDPTLCLSCANPYLLLASNSTCVTACPLGTTQSGSLCVPCSFNCLSCVSQSSCTKCSNSTYLYQGSCVYNCPLGTYPADSTCRSCNIAFCLQCSSPSICTTCDPNSGAWLFNGTCMINCPVGTYQASTVGQCTPCSAGCSACINSSYCSACVTGFYFSQGQCLQNCPNGTYRDNGVCKACSVGCFICTSQSNCTVCESNYSMYVSGSTSTCVLNCPAGYFAALMTSSNFNNSNYYNCVHCFSPCQTCSTSGTSCTSCVSGYSLQGTNCQSDCNSGYYPQIIFQTSIWGWTIEIEICRQCPSSCVTCSNSNTCTSCPGGFNLDQNGNCISSCPSATTYYDTATRQCLNCSATCYSCKGPLSTNCLSCYPPLQLFSGSCVSTCPFGYYSTLSYTCEPCSTNCASCMTNANNCTVCPSGFYLQTNSNGVSNCFVQCPSGTYLDTTAHVCHNCNVSCVNCTGPNDNNCISCSDGFALWEGRCLSACPAGTTKFKLPSGSIICKPCSTGCLVCQQSDNGNELNCTYCNTNLYLINGTCSSVCPIGTYSSPESFSCVDCAITGCYMCKLNQSLQVQCLACQAGYYLMTTIGICVTSCPSGYLPNNGLCVADLTCYFYLWNGYCVQVCPTGTYAGVSTTSANQTISTCNNCSTNCLSCSSLSVCIECAPGTLIMTTSTYTYCVGFCPIGYYNSSGLCLACPTKCLSCSQSFESVSCNQCNSTYLLLNGQCLTTCPAGYFTTNSLTCSLCASQCAECFSSATNCTVCKNSNYSIPSCVSQTCSSNQYQAANGSCLSCYTHCLSCYGGASYECTACSTGYFLLNGQCYSTCPQGYVAINGSCLACPSNCANCTSSTYCIQCSSSIQFTYLLTSSGQCVTSCAALNTNNVTYVSNNGSCVTCSSVIINCLACSWVNNNISCTSCQPGTYYYNGQCKVTCPSGTYNSTTQCLPCTTNCVTCSSSGCNLCSSGFVLSQGYCVSTCNTSYYVSTTNGVSSCSPCSSNCLTCSSNTACTSCVQPYTLVGGQCSGCISGYFFSSSLGICSKCSSQCAQCSVTSTNCTSCTVGYSLFQSNTCVSVCPTGYYSSSGVCVVCSVANCSVCPNNQCTSCQTGYVQVVINGTFSCSNTCPPSTYLESTINNCITCSTNCVNCSSATSCQVCSASTFLYLGYCLSVCPSGYTAVNGVCTACLSGCKACGPINNCTACNTGLVPTGNGTCIQNTTVNCSNGYYANSLGSCSQCYPTCQTCSGGSVSNCLSCFNGSILSSSGVCVQSCSTGSFFNSNTSVCQQCSTLFSQCLSCTQTGCTSCTTNYTLISGQCGLTCPSGTYLANQQCFSCSSYCSVCTSATTCTQCIVPITGTIFLYNGSCYTSCPLQTFQNGTTCSPCLQTCLSCTLSSSNCTSCISPYNLVSNTCVVTCPNGTYSNNYVCNNCSINCLLCSSATQCSSCASNYYLINGTCRSDCVAGYYLDATSGRCIQCVLPCTQCTSRTNCSACASPYTLSGTSCIGSCPTGSYYNSSLSSCINCSMTNCGVCTATSCLSCASGFYSYYSNGVLMGCLTTCLTSTFADNSTMNCSACFSNCQTCTNASFCSLCSSGYYLLSVAGVGVNECVTMCPLGYYQTLLRTCLACGSHCNQCKNSTYCQACQSNYFLFTTQDPNTATNMSCVSQCPSGYANPTIISGTGMCTLCPSHCISCVDSITCTQCITSTYVILNGQCTPYNCLNCLTCNQASNVCNECVNGYYLYENGCRSYCPNGYYADNSTKKCLKCMDKCLLCWTGNFCDLCINGYMFVNSTVSCENEGYINFGALGNMSGFTSNITQVMATVYVSTSSGPIAFGALASTYGVMQVCQFMYLMQGSTDGNEQLNNFLNSLSAVSYTTNPGNNIGNGSSSLNSTSGSRRRLTAIEYTSSFLQTNLPIFLIMICFVASYLLVLLFQHYQGSCCTSCPTIQKYMGYICSFMQKRFKFIYVDCVMWISYLPFTYFAILQLKGMKFDSGTNAISSLLAVVIIVIYPLYPLFILRKLFDKSDNPQENLLNYKAITLQLPLDQEQVANRPLCADFTCCPKENPDITMVEMSLSPWIDKVVRPVYNVDVPQYAEFRYFTIPHWRLAYASIKYFRKFLFVLIVAACPVASTTLGLLVALSIIYMAYLIVLRPKEKLYLVLEIILEILILFFEIFMLIYVTNGGATVTSLSIVAHAIGFALANSTLVIAIILNIMAYYTIFCCIVDLVRHMKAKAEQDEIKQIKQQLQILDEKDGFKLNEDGYEEYPEDIAQHNLEKQLQKDLIKKYGGEGDKELGGVKRKEKKGDDEVTEENDQDIAIDPYNFDEKEFNATSSMINKKKKEGKAAEGEDLPDLKQSQSRHRRRQSKKEKVSVPALDDGIHTEEEMGKSKLSNESNSENTNEGLLKERAKDRFKREVGGNNAQLGKQELRDPTDKFKRNAAKKGPEVIEQESLDYLYISPNAKRPIGIQEQVDSVGTHDRLRAKAQDSNTTPEAKVEMRKNAQKGGKDSGQNLLNENELQDAVMKERQKKKKSADPFGEFEQILDPREKKETPQDIAMKEREKKRALQKGRADLVFDDDDFNMIERSPQSKKTQENKFYKGSDQEDIGQVTTKERQGHRFKRGNKPGKGEDNKQLDINATGIDANLKKAEKKPSAKQFAEDDSEQLKYRERQSKQIRKQGENQNRDEKNLEELRGIEREKKKANKQKPSVFDQMMNADVTESITIPQGRARKPKAPEDDGFEQVDIEKQIKPKEQPGVRGKDNKLQVSSNLEESYDDVVNKNKQQMFKKDVAKKPQLLDVADEFEEVSYDERPASKRERSNSKNIDNGLSTSNRDNDASGDEGIKDIRKQRSSAIQKLRKRGGNLQVKEGAEVEQDNGSSMDSRRVAARGRRKQIKSGVLNISDNSDAEDIEEYHL